MLEYPFKRKCRATVASHLFWRASMELEQLSLNGGGPTTLLIRHRNNTICQLFRFYFFTMIILMIIVAYIFLIVLRHSKWQPVHSPVLTKHCGDSPGNLNKAHHPCIRAGNTGMSTNKIKGALWSFWMKSTVRFTFFNCFQWVVFIYKGLWSMWSITKRICLQVLTISLGKIF